MSRELQGGQSNATLYSTHAVRIAGGVTADNIMIAVAKSAYLFSSRTAPPHLPGGCDGLLHPELPAAGVRARGGWLCSCCLASAPAKPAKRFARHAYLCAVTHITTQASLWSCLVIMHSATLSPPALRAVR